MGSTIYCISGLGAGDKIFDRLAIGTHTLCHIPWLRPLERESMEQYAARMAESIVDTEPVMLGVSFGGIMAIEIAKQRPVKKMFIVSGVKKTGEIPAWMRNAGRLQLNKILPVKHFSLLEPLSNYRLGVSTEEERRMVQAYRLSVDRVYLDWAINQILNWKNDWLPENLVHIHGDKDRIFPVKKIPANYIIKGGTHMMVYNRGKEIGEFIQKEMGKDFT